MESAIHPNPCALIGFQQPLHRASLPAGFTRLIARVELKILFSFPVHALQHEEQILPRQHADRERRGDHGSSQDLRQSFSIWPPGASYATFKSSHSSKIQIHPSKLSLDDVRATFSNPPRYARVNRLRSSRSYMMSFCDQLHRNKAFWLATINGRLEQFKEAPRPRCGYAKRVYGVPKEEGQGMSLESRSGSQVIVG